MVSARAFSHARSLTAAAVAVAMMASVAVTAFIPTYSANADQSKDDGAFATSNTIHMGDGSTDVNEADTGLATYVGRDFYVGAPTDGETGTADGSIHGSWAAEMEGQTFILGKYMQRAQKGFFTIGTVAFGAQYKPAAGSTIIAVEGCQHEFIWCEYRPSLEVVSKRHRHDAGRWHQRQLPRRCRRQ